MDNAKAYPFNLKHTSAWSFLILSVLAQFLFSCGKSSSEEIAPVPAAPTTLAEGDVYYSNGKDGYVLHDPDGQAQVFKIASFDEVVRDVTIDDKNNKVYWLIGGSTVIATGPDGSVKNTWKKNIRMNDIDCAQGSLYIVDSTNSLITTMNTANGNLGTKITQINELLTVIYSLSASRYPAAAGTMYYGKRGVGNGAYFYYSLFNSITKLSDASPYCISVNPGVANPGKGLYLTQIANNIITLYESGVNVNEWSGSVVANDLLSSRFEVSYKKDAVYYANKAIKKLIRKDLSGDISNKTFNNVDVSSNFAVDVVSL